ncbi:pantoate--beta-alanine ligase [Bradyrhizobium sp. NBAIM01]|nr:pantoate--beta-alanine ligase [Bradyrhizobium sp. NBAIM01]
MHRNFIRALFETFIELGDLAKPMCRAFRAGKFRSFATVLCKLLNMVQSDVVFLARRIFSNAQSRVVWPVDLNLPIKIVTVPTVCELDGLAMSSRDRYLSREERQRALERCDRWRTEYCGIKNFASGNATTFAGLRSGRFRQTLV